MSAAATTTSPLDKVIFIQRIAKFSASSPRQAIKLCYISTEFRSSVCTVSNFLPVLLRPFMLFPNHLFLGNTPKIADNNNNNTNEDEDDEVKRRAKRNKSATSIFGIPLSDLQVSSRDQLQPVLKEKCDSKLVAAAINGAFFNSNLFEHHWNMREWKKFRSIIFWCFSNISVENHEILDGIIDLLKYLRTEFWKENLFHHILVSSFFRYQGRLESTPNLDLYESALSNRRNPNFFEQLSTEIFPLDLVHPKYTNFGREELNSENVPAAPFRNVVMQVKRLLQTAARSGNAEGLKYVLDPAKSITKLFVEVSRRNYLVDQGFAAGQTLERIVYRGLKESLLARNSIMSDENAVGRSPTEVFLKNFFFDYSKYRSNQDQSVVPFFPEMYSKQIRLDPSEIQKNLYKIFISSIANNNLELFKKFCRPRQNTSDNNNNNQEESLPIFDVRSVATSPYDNHKYTGFLIAVQFGSYEVIRHILHELFPVSLTGSPPHPNWAPENPFNNAQSSERSSAFSFGPVLKHPNVFLPTTFPAGIFRYALCHCKSRRALRFHYLRNNPMSHLGAMLDAKIVNHKYGNVKYRLPSKSAFIDELTKSPQEDTRKVRSNTVAVEIAKLIIDYCRKEESVIKEHAKNNNNNNNNNNTNFAGNEPFRAFGATLSQLMNHQNLFGETPLDLCLKTSNNAELAELFFAEGLIEASAISDFTQRYRVKMSRLEKGCEDEIRWSKLEKYLV